MRKIKGSSSYLKNQVRKNIAKAALSITILLAAIFVIAYRFLTTLQIDIFEEAGLVLLLVPLVAFYLYLHKYRIYSGGWQGEKQVANLLTSHLSDDYYLINDLYLHGGGGDIDHIVLGPGGVYVLETKNWSGGISCSGDVWGRVGKRNFSGSPSRQVKRNAQIIKRIIDNSSLRQLGIWVDGIVVFTNKHATLQLNNPTVTILKLPQLPSYITQKSENRYTRQQLEAIGKEIVRQKA